MSLHTARLATEKAVFRPALPLCHLPGIAEMHMKKLSYAEQLKHPNWQRKRLEVLDSANFACEECGAKDATLHVHHKRYVKGRMAWEYERDQLAALCDDCHTVAHEMQDALAEIMTRKFADWPIDEFMFGFLGGFLLPFKLVEQDESMRAYRVCQPSFELGVMMAALGPDDLKDGLRRKIESGQIDGDNPMMKMILSDAES